MEKQSILKQIAYGALCGVLFAVASRLKTSNPEQLLNARGAGVVIGGAIGGAFLYVILYRFWLRKK